MKQKVIIIVGPTASGKTALSLDIAKAVNGEIISADSRQVYRGLDIGTGKISKVEMGNILHHLLDVASPMDTFTASDFSKMGRVALREIQRRNHTPIIVGGTGFYIDALIGAISLAEVHRNEELREALSLLNTEELYRKLTSLDSVRAKNIDKKNKVRLVRAIEIASTLGSVPQPTSEALYDSLWIGLTLPKEVLEVRIHQRLIERFGNGMLNEGKNLLRSGISYERMEELGLEYRYMARHLQGLLSYEDMVQQLEVEIRKYAKRQMTWFNKNKNIQWFPPSDIRPILDLSKNFLSNTS